MGNWFATFSSPNGHIYCSCQTIQAGSLSRKSFCSASPGSHAVIGALDPRLNSYWEWQEQSLILVPYRLIESLLALTYSYDQNTAITSLHSFSQVILEYAERSEHSKPIGSPARSHSLRTRRPTSPSRKIIGPNSDVHNSHAIFDVLLSSAVLTLSQIGCGEIGNAN